MKIGELARISGIAASRIRFYEASGLLEPARRQANGYREYGSEALTRLAIIDRAQGAGFSLDEIRAVLPPNLGAWPHDELLVALRHKVDEIALLERRLAQNRQHLETLIDEIENKPAGEDCAGAAQRMLNRLCEQADAPPAPVPVPRPTRKRA
ncbi:MerR family transcriptional regulator [Burkholderia cepacia]|uniref:MerR family transcriptional regulator n=1 Tax=Burkholderia cepacia TaxID=292 RepID=UPI00075ECC5C|nr:MerR family transcriptional regulator [Burkholderia cepacia]KVV61851.1 MerR family transcriptional regulator [Burkholderia cepacia]KVV68959.1 MerR family transcriptional regulator [Burkholderia cepacia]KVV69330.1 MerR family transcriptional regulator [Burkholderia cepacia]KVV89366.1 MerR family transcriptional regulator [Burkholderia cepacia]KVV93735.1 MerR family transcriptional regulator [Burkholderia cepacia]